MKLLVAMLLAAQLGGGKWPGPAEVAPPPAEPAGWTAKPTDEFDRRLAALEVAVSTVVARPIASWRFDALKREADRLQSEATEESRRSAAADAASRIDQFATLAARSRNTRRPPARRRDPLAAPTAPTRLAPDVRLTKAKTREPGPDDPIRGVLRPVVSKRADAPKYGVVDERGRLAALVTPTAESAPRLDALLGRRVAIDGQRGFRTDVRLPHVVAERVAAERVATTPVRRR